VVGDLERKNTVTQKGNDDVREEGGDRNRTVGGEKMQGEIRKGGVEDRPRVTNSA